MSNKTTNRLMMGSSILMAFAGVIFVFLKIYLYAALLGAGTAGCIAGAMNCNSLKEKE